MLTIHGRKQRFCDGVSRRSFMKIGGFALGGLGGLTLSDLLRAEAAEGKIDETGKCRTGREYVDNTEIVREKLKRFIQKHFSGCREHSEGENNRNDGDHARTEDEPINIRRFVDLFIDLLIGLFIRLVRILRRLSRYFHGTYPSDLVQQKQSSRLRLGIDGFPDGDNPVHNVL